MELSRVTVRTDTLDVDKSVLATLPDVVDVVTYPAEDGQYAVVLEPIDPDLWDLDSEVEPNEGWEEARKAKAPIQVGDFVSWNNAGGRSQGKVLRIVRTGSIDVPDSSFTITADENDPAALIEVWQVTSDGNGPTDRQVGHKVSSLRRIPELRETMEKVLRHEGNKWCVYSEDGKPFGCYDTRGQAERRLQQMEMFKADTPETFAPPSGVRAAARRAQEWIADGKAGSNFTSVGSRRASQLAGGEAVSLETITRMRSYFARHERDKRATGFRQGEQGYPSPGRVAWDAWGGDAGKSWANRIYDRYKTEKVRPESAWRRGYDTEYLENRDAILSKSPMCRVCRKAKATEVDHIRPLIRGGSSKRANLRPVCASCGRKSGGGVRRAEKSVATSVSKEYGEHRYTMGPMYVPNTIDAQGEWTDEGELQSAVWEYVRSGDRRIRLQHDRAVVAGEWVEVMSWPFPVTVPVVEMEKGDRRDGEHTFPAHTVFLGVVWEPWAWELVKAGSLRGYSIGGNAGRIYADIPGEGTGETLFSGE